VCWKGILPPFGGENIPQEKKNLAWWGREVNLESKRKIFFGKKNQVFRRRPAPAGVQGGGGRVSEGGGKARVGGGSKL